MARSLMAAGVAAHRAYALANGVERRARRAWRGGDRAWAARGLAVEVLGEEEGTRASNACAAIDELRELDLPIVVFIGGATGTGKSTVATELAYRFGITRVTSTDFIRQTMRAFFSSDFMPSIHHSSFEAGDAFPDARRSGRVRLHVAVAERQRRRRRPRRSARSRRAGPRARRCTSRARPGRAAAPRGAVSVFVVLSIEDEEEHARHFRYRDEDSERPESRYLERFDNIRILQEIIVERAHAEGVPVIENDDADRAARTVADLVLDAADRSREANERRLDGAQKRDERRLDGAHRERRRRRERRRSGK